MAEKDPIYFTGQAQASMAKQVGAMVGFTDRGAEVFDYGNSIRTRRKAATTSLRFPGFVPAYIRPLFGRASGRSVGCAVRRP